MLSGKYDNVYLETSGNTYFFIDRAVKTLGPSKVIFGSDFPHEHPLVLVRSIELLNLSPKEKKRKLKTICKFCQTKIHVTCLKMA